MPCPKPLYPCTGSKWLSLAGMQIPSILPSICATIWVSPPNVPNCTMHHLLPPTPAWALSGVLCHRYYSYRSIVSMALLCSMMHMPPTHTPSSMGWSTHTPSSMGWSTHTHHPWVGLPTRHHPWVGLPTPIIHGLVYPHAIIHGLVYPHPSSMGWSSSTHTPSSMDASHPHAIIHGLV